MSLRLVQKTLRIPRHVPSSSVRPKRSDKYGKSPFHSISPYSTRNNPLLVRSIYSWRSNLTQSNTSVVSLPGATSSHIFRYHATYTPEKTVMEEDSEPLKAHAYHCATCNYQSKMPIFVCNACHAMDPKGGTVPPGQASSACSVHEEGKKTAGQARGELQFEKIGKMKKCTLHGSLPCHLCDPVAANAHIDLSHTAKKPSPDHACDYFDFFECPHKFNMDEGQLKQLTNRYRELQRVLHPDVYSGQDGTTAADIKVVQAQSAAIADAYRTLRNPYQRALHLLGLHGIDIDKLSEAKYDNIAGATGGQKPDFGALKRQEQAMLFQVMEVRETLDDSDDVDEVKDILRSAASQIEECLHAMEIAFEKKDLFDARHRTVLLNYLSKIQQEAENKLESMGAQ